MKTVLRQVRPESVWYDFEDETNIEHEVENETIVIAGNRDFKEFGDDTLVKVVKYEYYDYDQTLIENEDGTCCEEPIGYDYDVYDELKKLTGKEWDQLTIKGYSQGDWQDVYYAKGEVSDDRLEEIANFYMGKVSEFRDEDNCCYYVPDDAVWKGKKEICDYIGLNKDETEIYDDKGEEIE